MRGRETSGHLIEKVNEMSAKNHDETIPVKDISFEGLGSMMLGGKNMKVLESGQRLFANRLRVPYSYLSRCPMDLQAENLNYWIGEEAKTRDTLFCRFNGDGLTLVGGRQNQNLCQHQGVSILLVDVSDSFDLALEIGQGICRLCFHHLFTLFKVE